MGAMRIDEIYAAGDRPVFSFEFFPPRTPEGEANLYLALAALRPLAPDFVSLTYGAGGSTRGKTLEIVSRIRDEIGLEAMAHFTCVGATVDELRSTLDEMSAPGLRERPRAARRSAAGPGGVDEDRGRPRVLARARRAHQRRLPRLLDRRGVLPGDPHPRHLGRGRPALPQGEGRRRRRLPHHPALLRQRALLRLRRPRPRDRHRGPDRARASCPSRPTTSSRA